MRSSTVPAWAPALLAAQVAIVYFYGGLAKPNGDWLRGEPMRMWLSGNTDFPVIGHLFTEEWMVYAFSYGGLLFDLLIVPLLLWRRTRPFAFIAAFAFHFANANLFQIGIFPMFMPTAREARVPRASRAVGSTKLEPPPVCGPRSTPSSSAWGSTWRCGYSCPCAITSIPGT